MFGNLADWRGDTIIIHTFYARHEFSVTERGVMPEVQVLQLADGFDGLALITCISDHHSYRYGVLTQRLPNG
ncbi:MAG: hypothetical protein FWC20_08975 [Oscillospiraceae bacterium]|nr:hypothetical protein [Oscillospiraceae bacterium]MCL2279521.1 hypothetical protein [Oscillospiraceae bacterium]